MKKMLTDRAIRAIKVDDGGRVELWDAVVPGLGIRASATAKSFVLVTRYPGSRNPTRRSLGKYGAITLQDARIKARRWLELIEHGKDPAVELERERLAEARKRADTFSAVAAAFIEQKLSKERQGYDAGRCLQRFIDAWGNRPIVDIEKRDIRAVIDPVKTHAPYMAHAMLSIIRRFFSWVVAQDIYGVEISPCTNLRAADIIGKRKPRQRVLSDDEIIALHQAASEVLFPHGPLLLFLLFSGQRHMDCAHATWSEISLERREWIIPAARFKSETAHVVPLSDPLVGLLSSLPRIKGNDRLFPLSRGIVDEAKAKLDARMREILGARNPDTKLERWVIHDVRRTVRTRLTQLRVQTEVAEAVIGHGKRGLDRHYNQYAFQPEKAHALEAWAAWLRDLTSPPADNVVAIARAS
jgi:integrase